MTSSETLPIAIIGAGPVGLAAAAHLLDRGLEPVILERGLQVGGHFKDFSHVRLFSPWRYNIDKAVRARLLQSGWLEPDPEDLPTAEDVLNRSLIPFAALPEIVGRLRLGTRVTAITRQGLDKVKTAGRDHRPFQIRYLDDDGVHEIAARAVIDASGTWSQPNPLGSSGIAALGERENHDRIFYGIPDILGHHRSRYAGKRVLVVGAGHSAANSLLALAQLADLHTGTRLVWAVRGKDPARAFGGGASDALPARGQLGSALKALRTKGGLELVTDFHMVSISLSRRTLDVAGVSGDGTQAFEIPTSELPDDWMNARTDIKVLLAEQKSAQQVLKDDFKSKLPEITAMFDPQYVTPNGLFQPSKSWRLTFELKQSLYTGGGGAGLKRERQANQQIADFNLVQRQIQARSEIRTAREARESAERVLKSARAASAQASEVLKITIVAFDAGASTNLEVVEAQRTARDVETALAQAEDALRQAQFDLLVALGRFPN